MLTLMVRTPSINGQSIVNKIKVIELKTCYTSDISILKIKSLGNKFWTLN